MLLRSLGISILAFQVILCATGCEQIKEYRMKAYYEKARQLYESQDYGAALREIKYALAFNPDYVDALALSGICQYELKNYEAAVGDLEAVLLLDASRDDLVMIIADSLFHQSKFFRAVIQTGRLLDKDPGDDAVRILDARIRLRSRYLNLWAEVDKVLQPLLAAGDYKEEAFALLAEFHILNDDLARAEAVLNEHAHLNEDWLFVMRMLGAKYESQADLDSAARIYGRVLELKPDSTEDAYALLAVLRKADKKDAELQLLESLIAADQQSVGYKLKLIDFYIHCGRFEDAEQLILSVRKQDEGYFDFSAYLIEVYEKTQRYAEAVAVAKEVLGRVGDDRPLQVKFMNILARLYYMRNNLALAKIVVRWVLGIDRNSHEARFLLSRISLDEGRTLLAIAELRALASEDLKNPDYAYYLGLAHMARSENSAAEQSFKSALTIDPSYKPALMKIVGIYFDKGFFLDLERMVNEFLAVSPDDPDVLALRDELAQKKAAAAEAG